MDYGLIDLAARMRKTDFIFPGSFPSLVEKEGEHGDLRRLDYVFASENLTGKVTGAEIISTETSLFLSDHLPVIVDIKIK